MVVREALMEPLRKCRAAKFFVPAGMGADGRTMMWSPTLLDPPCSRCPVNLSATPVPAGTVCASCGARRCTLFDLRTEELRVPDMCAEDFETVLSRTKATVAARELARFEEFTAEFGSSGE